MKIEIYTDGACKGNPGPGGWGAILKFGDQIKEVFGGEKMTTNNRMELTAAIQALNLLKERSFVHIYTDSKYLKDGISLWMHNWVKNNWQSSAKQSVKNRDLWEKIYQLSQNHDITWSWVKAHNAHPMNERADFLANKGVLSIN